MRAGYLRINSGGNNLDISSGCVFTIRCSDVVGFSKVDRDMPQIKLHVDLSSEDARSQNGALRSRIDAEMRCLLREPMLLCGSTLC